MSAPDKHVQRIQRGERWGKFGALLGVGALLGTGLTFVEMFALMYHPELLQPFGPHVGSDGGFILKNYGVNILLGEGITFGVVGINRIRRGRR